MSTSKKALSDNLIQIIDKLQEYFPGNISADDLKILFEDMLNYFEENKTFFDNCGYAFCLKPENLRFKPVVIPTPTPQNPALSYATRDVKTDYYNFKY